MIEAVNPLVSVIIAFLNESRFLSAALASVAAQSYLHWELLLVDDGSTDGSSGIALDYAASHPGRIRYFEHAQHKTRGVSASRNLGMRHAQGKYIAFLDGDDVWMPHKLARQVGILESCTEAGMTYGDTEWWFSWTGKAADAGRDYTPQSGVAPNTLMSPPSTLLTAFLRGEARVPCTSSLLLRREVVRAVGDFDESFHIYEDQAFYAKVCTVTPVFVAGDCYSRYRQHPNSACASAKQKGERDLVRLRYLDWLEEYLTSHNIADSALLAALRRKRFRHRHPAVNQALAKAWNRLARPLRTFNRLARRTLPHSFSRLRGSKPMDHRLPPA
jgi:glycosyltransferase involved in cell wall biosynthesis